MRLELNHNESYLPFEGTPQSVIPQIFKQDRLPLSIAQIMERRISLSEDETIVGRHWWRQGFYTPDLLIATPKFGVKVVPYTTQVKDSLLEIIKLTSRFEDHMSERTVWPGDSVMIRFHTNMNRLAKHVEGLSISFDQIAYYNREWHNAKSAKESPIWRTLAGCSQDLLDRYVDAVERKVKDFKPFLSPVYSHHHNYCFTTHEVSTDFMETDLGLYVDNKPDFAYVRFAKIGGLYDEPKNCYGRSNLDMIDCDNLLSDLHRVFVGYK